MIKHLQSVLLTLLLSISAFGQQNFSIEQAVNYALEHHNTVKSSQIDILDAEKQIEELKRTGLPQINGSFSYTYNAIIPSQLLEAKNFDPNAAEGELVKFSFGVPYGGQAGMSLSQMIFDGTWLVGLRAADTYRLLASQNVNKSKETVTENVIKAYYSVLVAEERSKLLDLNIDRLASVIGDTKALLNEGFVEQLDIDRLTVQQNNLLTERSKTKSLIQFSYKLLKFQMQMDQSAELVLTSKLDDGKMDVFTMLEYEEVNPQDRIDYQVLNTQKRLTELNLESIQKRYLPSVNLTATLGASHSGINFTPFKNWFGSSAITLGVNIPLFDSGYKRQQIDRQRLALRKLDLGAKTLEESFKLANNQAYINLRNGLENLEVQKRNLELSKEIVRVSTIKYKEGVGSNLEIIEAENDLRQSETNYFAALYDVIIAKIDIDKAQGKLVKF